MAFWQLRVPSSPDASDGLTNFLWEQGALGVVEEETGIEPARLLAFFPETASSTALVHAVRAYQASLRALGFEVDPDGTEIHPLVDEAWASAWQQAFPPRAIGDGLLVLPPWEAVPAGDARAVLVIEPGRAFGTGHHGSTEGSLRLLEGALARHPGARVLDVGTGSGILAVAAIKLGAASVLAIDIDPDAVAAARANAERNGCGQRIEVALAAPGSLAPEAFPIVVANLLAHTHIALRSTYARLVAPGGALVLGGILADEDGPVVEALAPAGFTLAERLGVDGWCAVALTGAGPSGPRA
jgi:ribosomal protein L11 methyltransferase